MTKIFTPARLAAALGVVTGLGASVTSVANVFPAESHVGRAVIAASGVLGVAGVLIKFLDGQSNWETTVASIENSHVLSGLAPLVKDAEGVREAAVLAGNEQPIDAEPTRLLAQSGAIMAAPPLAVQQPAQS